MSVPAFPGFRCFLFYPSLCLQLATPDAVFLLDMHALCSSGSSNNGSSDTGESSSGNGTSSGLEGSNDGAPVQQYLSSLLVRLFSDASIVKAGFGLATDLDRLCESYPHLPCFGSQGSMPFRCATPVS